MNILYIIFYILSFICILLNLYFNHKVTSVSDNKKKKIFYVISNIVLFIGPLTSFFGSQIEGKISNKELNKNIEQKSDSIKDLLVSNKTLTELVLKNTNKMTSVGSKPKLIVGNAIENGHKTQLIILLDGEYAIPNLTIQVAVVPNYSKTNGMDIKTIADIQPIIPLGTLRPYELKSYFVSTVSNETFINVLLKSDNENWYEQVRIIKNNKGRFLFYTSFDKENNVFTNRIDPDFPTNKEGKYTIWSNESKSRQELGI